MKRCYDSDEEWKDLYEKEPERIVWSFVVSAKAPASRPMPPDEEPLPSRELEAVMDRFSITGGQRWRSG